MPMSPAPRVVTAGLSPAQAHRAVANLQVFDTVWDTVNSRYYDPRFHGEDWRSAALIYGPKAAAATDDAALYEAMNAMLGRLHDEHTGASTPLQARDFRTQKSAMTGFRLLRINGVWAVDEVLPGSSAAAAGVKPGWIVLTRDGQQLGEPLQLPTLSGGEIVRWEFLDARDQPVALALTASRVSTVLQQCRALPGGALYLRFDEFDWSKMRWLSKQLKSHRDAPGVVIDLRHNPGGTLFALDFMLGEFFDQRFTFAIAIDRAGHQHSLRTLTFGSAHYPGRVAILVDHLSGSAAELFAGVMQEKHRAVIVGHRSAGAVLSARFRTLPDGGVLEYSDRDLLTAQNRRLQGNGVVPDRTTPAPTLADLRAGRDPDVEAALQAITQS